MKDAIKIFLAVLVILLISGACLFVPFLIDEKSLKPILSGLEILAAVSSVLTLLIAVLIFNKFGIEESLLKRQTEVLHDLLGAMKKFGLRIHNEGIYINFTIERRNEPFLEPYHDSTLLFSSDIFSAMKEIDDCLGDVFMPNEIRRSFLPLQVSILAMLPKGENTLHNYFMVDSRVSQGKKENDSYGHLNNVEMTFKQYTDVWKDCIEAVKGWLQKNSSLKVDLNI